MPDENTGSGYTVLHIRAERHHLKVKLGVQPGTTDQPGYLNKLWVEDRDGQEMATVMMPRKADLNEAAELILEQLELGPATA